MICFKFGLRVLPLPDFIGLSQQSHQALRFQVWCPFDVAWHALAVMKVVVEEIANLTIEFNCRLTVKAARAANAALCVSYMDSKGHAVHRWGFPVIPEGAIPGWC